MSKMNKQRRGDGEARCAAKRLTDGDEDGKRESKKAMESERRKAVDRPQMSVHPN